MADKRELRIEISVTYHVWERYIAEAIRDIRDAARHHLIDPAIQITDNIIDDTPSKMFCPHCDKVISGIVFKEEQKMSWNGPEGEDGPPGRCPKCNSSNLEWDSETEHLRCLTCGWEGIEI